ncbi:MAG: Plug domain-containing protein, partial [Bacteroidales bacterium]|nr:Plug domain-containing protein [Bacteroidales bacterium]
MAAITAAPAFAANPATGNDGVADSHDKVEKLDSVIVSASRAGKSTPVTYTMVGKEQLRSSNPINSLPMQLNLTPSAVAVNEGGTGIGYSKMTVRGSKGSQINVTLNGITLNDAESQEVFWVNIPSLSNILSSVQVQRGL